MIYNEFTPPPIPDRKRYLVSKDVIIKQLGTRKVTKLDTGFYDPHFSQGWKTTMEYKDTGSNKYTQDTNKVEVLGKATWSDGKVENDIPASKMSFDPATPASWVGPNYDKDFTSVSANSSTDSRTFKFTPIYQGIRSSNQLTCQQDGLSLIMVSAKLMSSTASDGFLSKKLDSVTVEAFEGTNGPSLGTARLYKYNTGYWTSFNATGYVEVPGNIDKNNIYINVRTYPPYLLDKTNNEGIITIQQLSDYWQKVKWYPTESGLNWNNFKLRSPYNSYQDIPVTLEVHNQSSQQIFGLSIRWTDTYDNSDFIVGVTFSYINAGEIRTIQTTYRFKSGHTYKWSGFARADGATGTTNVQLDYGLGNSYFINYFNPPKFDSVVAVGN